MARSGIRAVGGSGLNDNAAGHDEIIELLQQVGQRLIHSERERRELRRALEDIAEKADQGERAYLTIQDRLNKTESLIEKRQKAIEKAQKEQMERIEKAAAMADRIEEAIAQHEKIARRLDRVMQDKTRMIRKLERIEEAIIETQDAVKARDLVVASRMTAAQAAHPSGPDDAVQDAVRDIVPKMHESGTREEAEADAPSPRRQHLAVRMTVVAAMIVLGVFGGLSIGAIRSGFSGFPDDPQQAISGAQETAVAAAPTPPMAEDIAPVKAQAALAADSGGEEDILKIDDAALAARFEENPDALAAQLNDISPSMAADIIGEIQGKPAKIAASVAAPSGDAARPQDAAFSPEAPSGKSAPAAVKKQEAATLAAFLKAQADSRPLRERIAEDKNLPAAILPVQKKAFDGLAEAQHDLAAIYTAGHAGVSVDYEKAAQWFGEAALNGVANARYNLGVLYHQGMGVPKDIDMAVKWYRAAAAMDHPEAQYNLAIAYIEGVGMPYDPEKAAYYFEQAAGKGIMEAAYNLGLIHENGLTGTGKTDEALYWYKQAADLGSPEAKAAMDQLSKALDLAPDAVEKLYESVKKTKQAAAPPAKEETTGKTATAQRKAGIDYIEAQPLEPLSSSAAPPAASGRRANEADQNQAVIAQIQEQLIRMGLYPGPADGVMDSLTEDAIRAYQAQYSLEADGRPGQALLVHMMTSGLEGAETGSRER